MIYFATVICAIAVLLGVLGVFSLVNLADSMYEPNVMTIIVIVLAIALSVMVIAAIAYTMEFSRRASESLKRIEKHICGDEEYEDAEDDEDEDEEDEESEEGETEDNEHPES